MAMARNGNLGKGRFPKCPSFNMSANSNCSSDSAELLSLAISEPRGKRELRTWGCFILKCTQRLRAGSNATGHTGLAAKGVTDALYAKNPVSAFQNPGTKGNTVHCDTIRSNTLLHAGGLSGQRPINRKRQPAREGPPSTGDGPRSPIGSAFLKSRSKIGPHAFRAFKCAFKHMYKLAFKAHAVDVFRHLLLVLSAPVCCAASC